MAAPKSTKVKTAEKKTPVRKSKSAETSKASTAATASVNVNRRGRKAQDSKVTKEKKTTTADEMTSEETTPKRKINISRKWVLLVSGAVILLGLVYLGSKYLVVAIVDNQPITRFELINSLEKRYGKDLREQMIVEKLILSEANKKGIAVSEDEISQEIKKLEEQQGGADQLNQILQVQGISQDEFKKLIKLQIIRQKLFGDNVNITEEEVDKYLEENKDSLPEATPGAQIELRNNIKEQLKQQKVGTDFNSWLQSQLQGERVRRF